MLAFPNAAVPVFMPEFAYKARRRSGEVVQGVLEVADRSTALIQIERLGLFPVMIEAAKGAPPGKKGAAPRSAGSKSQADALPPLLRAFLKGPKKPKLQALATYTQQLANLLKSGMPLTVALNSMGHLETKGISTDVSKALKQDVMEGKGLSDAMAKQPHVFSDLYINMVKAGEQSGALVEVLKRMAEHFVRFAEVQDKFKSAMIYPAFVAVTGISIMVFFLTYMLPKFLTIFQGLQVKLPASTLLLIGISDAFKKYWFVGILVIIAFFVILNRFKATPRGKRAIDMWKLQVPLFGKVFKLNVFGQFCRTLGTLLENGVPVLTALQITEDVIPNIIIKEAIAKTRQEVTDGKTIAQPLASTKVFPQLMVDLVKIGEETGDVPTSLNSLADTYEGELSSSLKVLTNMIEPVLIIVMALGVGFLLLSVLSAMFSITATISK
jgi:type II secretory pathway component PulF